MEVNKKTSEAKIRANIKSAKKNLKRIPLDVRKEYYRDVIESEADKRKMSVRGFILAAIDEKIEREKDLFKK